jgi:hypothetical protein
MVTERNVRSIKSLYFIHRYIPSTIARLYGVSAKHILEILHKESQNVTMIVDLECLLCGLNDARTYYIDGNEKNKRPQNVITLCEADRRMVQHLQFRRRNGSVTPQMES